MTKKKQQVEKKKAKKMKKTARPFVEMETDLSSYDDDAVYPVDDDPYRGRRRPVLVEFMALDLVVCDRCQGTDARVEAAVEKCRPVLEACGVDICPAIEENTCTCCSDMSDSPIKCRMYPFNGTFYEVPPVDLVVQGIMNAVVSGEVVDPLEEPYELPENFAVFFEGVRKKALEKAEGGPCCCGEVDRC